MRKKVSHNLHQGLILLVSSGLFSHVIWYYVVPMKCRTINTSIRVSVQILSGQIATLSIHRGCIMSRSTWLLYITV